MTSKLNSRKTAAVLFGGKSLEHEISILTALQVLSALDASRWQVKPVYVDPQGVWWTGKKLWQRDFYKNINFRKLKKIGPEKIKADVFLPLFHGAYGEDGAVQGLLELTGIPYAGPGVLAAAIGMNKAMAKEIARINDIPVLPHILVKDWNLNQPDLSMPLPAFVKPNHLGSSIGVSAARTKDQLLASLAGAFALDYEALVEPLIENLTEFNVAVFGDKISHLEEPQKEGHLLSFEEKYLKGGKSKGMASMKRNINPKTKFAPQIKKWAKEIYDAINCAGIARVDFMLDKDRQQIYFEEINTIPGSLAYYLWHPLTLTELLNQLLDSAIGQYNKRVRNTIIEKRIFNV